MKTFVVTKNLTYGSIHLRDSVGNTKTVEYNAANVDEIECGLLDKGYKLAESQPDVRNSNKILRDVWIKP